MKCCAYFAFLLTWQSAESFLAPSLSAFPLGSYSRHVSSSKRLVNSYGATESRKSMLRMTPISQAASGQKASVTSNPKYALLFDCDGVIVLTEELHRLAYNGAFQDYNLKIGETPVDWNVEYYDVLQNTVGGGKPKMKWHFNKNGWPSSRLGPAPTSAADQDRLVDELQDRKTEIYKRIVTEVAQARPGLGSTRIDSD